MTTDISIALVGLLGSLLGSLSTGFISYLTNKNMTSAQWARDARDKEISKREQLYGDFLAESHRLAVGAMIDKTLKDDHFSLLVRLQCQIEFKSSTVNACAVKITDCVLVYHKEGDDDEKPNLAKLRAEFVSASHADIKSLQQAA